MQLNLRHKINSDILIYPGYIPEPGIEPRVFHYGLEFRVGDWSFDKANWRNTDVVNTCWATFPDPPDPSTLSSTDENTLQRDRLSIECMRTLNEALHLHHKRRNCSDPSTKTNMIEGIKEEVPLPWRFEGNGSSLHKTKKFSIQDGASHLSLLDVADHAVSSLRVWMIGLWAFTVLGFLAVIWVVLSKHEVDGIRRKAYKNKRKSYYSEFPDATP